MLAHEAGEASGSVEQVQRDRVRHHLGHEPHHLVFEPELHFVVAFEELDPVRHGQARDAHLGDSGDAVGDGSLHPPCCIGGIHVGFGRKAQDHLLALRIADDAFQDAVEDEELLHARAALPDERLALAVLGHFELRLEVLPGRHRHFAQHQVLLELQANRVALGVIEDGRHGRLVRERWTDN